MEGSNARAGALFVLGLVALGCGPPPVTMTPAPGALKVTLVPRAPKVSDLSFEAGAVRLTGLTVLGDVAPDGRAMVPELALDLRGPGKSVTLPRLPQGLYSRVRFKVQRLTVKGEYDGDDLSLELSRVDMAVDLRAISGEEIAPGVDGEFQIVLDASAWFAGVDLSEAKRYDGEIEIDDEHNRDLAEEIRTRIPGAFHLDEGPVL